MLFRGLAPARAGGDFDADRHVGTRHAVALAPLRHRVAELVLEPHAGVALRRREVQLVVHGEMQQHVLQSTMPVCTRRTIAYFIRSPAEPCSRLFRDLYVPTNFSQ